MMVDTRQFAQIVRLNDGDIRRQLTDCQRQGWALVIEHTADVSPTNWYWDRWGVPIYDPDDPDAVMSEIAACRRAFPAHFIRVNACQAGRGQALIRRSLLVHSPESGDRENS